MVRKLKLPSAFADEIVGISDSLFVDGFFGAAVAEADQNLFAAVEYELAYEVIRKYHLR